MKGQPMNPADVSPTDANGYLGPVANPNAPASMYPRWMYHPTLPNQIVADPASQAALQASDPLWATVDAYSSQ